MPASRMARESLLILNWRAFWVVVFVLGVNILVFLENASWSVAMSLASFKMTLTQSTSYDYVLEVHNPVKMNNIVEYVS